MKTLLVIILIYLIFGIIWNWIVRTIEKKLRPTYGKQLGNKFMVHFAVIITWPITFYVLVSSYYKKIKSSKNR